MDDFNGRRREVKLLRALLMIGCVDITPSIYSVCPTSVVARTASSSHASLSPSCPVLSYPSNANHLPYATVSASLMNNRYAELRFACWRRILPASIALTGTREHYE